MRYIGVLLYLNRIRTRSKGKSCSKGEKDVITKTKVVVLTKTKVVVLTGLTRFHGDAGFPRLEIYTVTLEQLTNSVLAQPWEFHFVSVD